MLYVKISDAAGNFLCPAAGLSFNAFRTVMDIDAMGTFNVTKVVFDQYMKVSISRVFLNTIIIVLGPVIQSIISLTS